MEYYYLKIGTGNAQARDWLAGKNPLAVPAAVIWFDPRSLEEYEAGKGDLEPRTFWNRGKDEFREQTMMVVVHEGEVWILKPAQPVRFLPADGANTNTRKAMPVTVLAHRSAKDVPLVLASITANQYYTRGTFRRINNKKNKDWGNCKAIDCVAGGPLEGEHWAIEKQQAAQLLECLSSVELETLVAKLLEARGCFVPAYRGGGMKDIDLFAHNDSGQPVCIDHLVIQPHERVSLQIKRWSKGMTKPASVDYLIGLDVKGENAFNANWLMQRIQESSNVMNWFCRSLAWLPADFLNKTIARLKEKQTALAVG